MPAIEDGDGDEIDQAEIDREESDQADQRAAPIAATWPVTWAMPIGPDKSDRPLCWKISMPHLRAPAGDNRPRLLKGSADGLYRVSRVNTGAARHPKPADAVAILGHGANLHRFGELLAAPADGEIELRIGMHRLQFAADPRNPAPAPRQWQAPGRRATDARRRRRNSDRWRKTPPAWWAGRQS